MKNTQMGARRSAATAITRRRFIGQAAGGAAAFATGGSHTALAAPASTLSIYILMWESVGPRIRWLEGPRRAAEDGIHVIWRYIQKYKSTIDRSALLENAFDPKRMGTVIGHAALFAKLERQDGKKDPAPVLFSNSGGNVGFYANPRIPLVEMIPGVKTTKFPEHAPYDRWLLNPDAIWACSYLAESLAGHLGDGKWQNSESFLSGIKDLRDPGVHKEVLRGNDAVSTFALFEEIKKETRRSNFEKTDFGGPFHYGLNTAKVRLLPNFDSPRPLKRHRIGGKQHEIHGGCGNAIASILAACGLERLVPHNARFRFSASLNALQNLVVPVVQNSAAFNSRVAVDEDLTNALKSLPEKWGSGDEIAFVDPNYWYDAIPPSKKNLDDFKRAAGI